jgi:hypothetical protein
VQWTSKENLWGIFRAGMWVNVLKMVSQVRAVAICHQLLSAYLILVVPNGKQIRFGKNFCLQ